MSRYVYAASWLIASEICRKNPDMYVIEFHPASGTYDILSVRTKAHLKFSEKKRSGTGYLDMNRNGSIRGYHDGSERNFKTWQKILYEGKDIREVITEILFWLELKNPTPAPQTTPKVLAYRFIASVLNLMLTDTKRWDARCDYLDDSGIYFAEGNEYGHTTLEFLEKFPAAVEHAKTVKNVGMYGEPNSHYYGLIRGEEVQLLVSIEGIIFFKDGTSADLMKLYNKHNRKLTAMVVEVMEPWLK